MTSLFLYLRPDFIGKWHLLQNLHLQGTWDSLMSRNTSPSSFSIYWVPSHCRKILKYLSNFLLGKGWGIRLCKKNKEENKGKWIKHDGTWAKTGGQREVTLAALWKRCAWWGQGVVTQRYRELFIASYFGVWASDTNTYEKDQKSLNKLKQAW